MKLEKLKCSNCGGTISYNKKLDVYQCQYCNTFYKDTNEGEHKKSRENVTLRKLNDEEKSIIEDLVNTVKTFSVPEKIFFITVWTVLILGSLFLVIRGFII